MKYVLFLLMTAMVHLGTSSQQAHAWFGERTSQMMGLNRTPLQRIICPFPHPNFHAIEDKECLQDLPPLQHFLVNEEKENPRPPLTVQDAQKLTDAQLKTYLRLIWKDQLQ